MTSALGGFSRLEIKGGAPNIPPPPLVRADAAIIKNRADALAKRGMSEAEAAPSIAASLIR